MGVMATHRIFVPDLYRGIVDLSPNEAHHTHAVMRLKSGDAVELFDGKGTVGTGTIQGASKRTCSVEVSEIKRVERSSTNHLTLAMAMPKSPRHSFLFEKCTELGVGAILPVTFDRSVVKTSSSGIKKWQRTIVEAAKQCRTAYLPEILEPLRFKDAAGTIATDAMQLICDPSANAKVTDQIRALRAGQNCTVWIGPEGGMTDAEVEHLSAQGAIKVALGANILRIETAAIAVAAVFALQTDQSLAG
ncbi:MAG: ribosomal RNA small subunit methyltransferase E [Phycisphaerae bacterium]|nr:MAG: ribosomal RNA small subunit methyltransferase E [Phycisphaerae bacterium]